MKHVALSKKDISILTRVMSKSAFEYEEINDFIFSHSDIDTKSNAIMFVSLKAFDDMLEAIESYLLNADEHNIPFLDKWETEKLFDRLKFGPLLV